ncbi:hypothetical protein BJV74DRAFT_879129 [Russula compacta]|nr:hypothetical protein BJV74DRAFT_879129 [Russula compacta]
MLPEFPESCGTTYTRSPQSRRRTCAIKSGAFKQSQLGHNADHRASSKLFADAEHEGREDLASATPPRTIILPGMASEHPNWTGDESIEDAVLRMLVDKYKPLRTGTIKTAEEKMRRVPPQVATQPPTMLPMSISENPSAIPSSSSHPRVHQADEVLLPAVEGHKPWLTTFKVPSHATASIRYGHFPAVGGSASSSKCSSTRSIAQSGSADDDRARRKEREVKKRSEIARRLTRAKEFTLDYRLGITKSSGVQARSNPVSMKGWAGLVEERIERARLEGHFRTIKGRGMPLRRDDEEHNPFIAREEFLMNRIVQRQGAAPPWVEIQGELDAALATFRAVLKQSWVRRAVRMLTLSPRPLYELSLADVRALRDGEWEARERAYHESALVEVNALVRKYNALAPYAVRRPYYVLDVELGRAYEESGEDILGELGGRLRNSGAWNPGGRINDDVDGGLATVGGQSSGRSILWLRDLFWQWFRGRGRTWRVSRSL